mgnify:CR=1 FL=1
MPGRKRGRPKKEINTDEMLHMMRNGAPVRVVARLLGVHRDTLYARYHDVIEAGRRAARQHWLANRDAWLRKRDAAHAAIISRRRLERMCGATTTRNTACLSSGINGGRCINHQGRWRF